MNAFTVEVSTHRSRREDGAALCRAVARKVVLGLSLTLVCQTALAQAMYRIKPLGYLNGCTSYHPEVFGFNGADEVTGYACSAHGDEHAFLWKNDGHPMVDLGPDEVGSTSHGYALNASGLVTGYASDSTGTYGFVSSGDGTPMKKIPNGFGGSDSSAWAINDLGQVTGSASLADGTEHAFLWKNDGSPMRDLGNSNVDYLWSQGGAINASGQVAGFVYDGEGDSRASVWKNDGKPMVDLGTLGGVKGSAGLINASGQVAGESSVSAYSPIHGFFWRNDGGPMHDLGTLGGAQTGVTALNDSGQIAGWSDTLRYLNPHAFVWLNNGSPMKNLGTFGGTQSQANDINASGQVTGIANLSGDTGRHAFLWRNDGTKIQDLNTLIDSTDPLKSFVTLTEGDFINDSGDILARGTDSRTGVSAPYLLQGTVLTLAPRSLAFGNHPIHTTSAAKSVTVSNTSAKVVAITSIALKGAAPGQFASTNNCGSSLVGHAICTIKVTFKPTTKGAKTTTLNVNGGGGGLRTVKLTGTGT